MAGDRSRGSLMSYFLNLVDLENWERLLRGEDNTWGFTKSPQVGAKRKLRRGALLICLLMKHHRLQPRWCGVLEVVGDSLPPDDPRVVLGSRFPVRFPVGALVALHVEEAIPVFHQSVWPCLSRTQGIEPGAPGWITKARLFPDLTDLGAHDGPILVSRLLAEARHPPLPYDADAAVSDPAGATGTLSRVLQQIAERRGQKAFRDELLRAYGGRCAITGCEIVDVLEAAHITPYSELGTNHVTNGLLLRADLHTLFDYGLIGVDPNGSDGRTAVVAERLRTSEYGALHGRPIRVPEAGKAPSEKALQQHMERMGFFGLTAESRSAAS